MDRDQNNIVAVSIGNSRTAIGWAEDDKMMSSIRCDNTDLLQIIQQITTYISDAETDTQDAVPIVLGSVNERVEAALRQEFEVANLDDRVIRVGQDVEIPIGRCLDHEVRVGDDRLLNAAAAYHGLKQACVIIDAGTAVTIDFVDGEGTFHGGAIAPGAQLQLNALHTQTSLLPKVRFAAPSSEAFGPNTEQAMLHGVFYGIRGMVRHLIERYAEAYLAYPKIVATGGDAQMLFEGDELIEHVVDELTLRGLAISVSVARKQVAGGSVDV